jgi:hypothetical protein
MLAWQVQPYGMDGMSRLDVPDPGKFDLGRSFMPNSVVRTLTALAAGPCSLADGPRVSVHPSGAETLGRWSHRPRRSTRVSTSPAENLQSDGGAAVTLCAGLGRSTHRE